MLMGSLNLLLKSKKAQESDSALPMSELVKILLAIITAVALYFIIRGIRNGVLPK